MMFSTEKCTGHSRTGSPEETEIFAGGGEGMGKESVPSDEVASAVAAVSDEIGDILKDELGDADRVDRIGAELADLSAELGLLAGLADGEPQQDFPSLFEIAMGHRGSASGSSSSTSSSSGAQRTRRNARPLRPNRRRPIGKQGKEMSRRRAALGRRVVTLRLPRIEILSDASDVGADSDSDDQWTEFDESGSSDSSSGKEVVPIPDVDCSHFREKEQEALPEAEMPPMGQFLLPLLSAESAPQEHFLIRHEDILQLLASAEESARAEMPVCEDAAPIDQSDMVSNAELFSYEDPTVSAEEEAALLQYVAEAERQANAAPVELKPVEEWLMGVFHSWCEISALMYTMCGTSMSTETETEEWLYLGRFPCHCRLCLCLADSDAALNALVTRVNTALLKEEETRVDTAVMVRTLMSQRGAALDPAQIQITDRGAELIHEQLCRVAEQSELARQVIETTCLCRPLHTPLDVEHAVERYFRIMENFKAASTVTFKVELVQPDGSQSPTLARASRRLARYLAKYQYCATKARLRDCAARTSEQEVLAWTGYKHRCECLTPRTLCAQQRKELLRLSFFGLMQVVNELNKSEPQADGEKPPSDVQMECADRELQYGDGTGAKPPDATDLQLEQTDSGKERSDSHPTAELDDDESDLGSGTASLGLSTSSSLDSASELLLAAAAAVESGGSESESLPGELFRTVRHLMRSIASIERLMDRVLRHCDDWPSSPNTQNETRKKVDQGLSEVDRKLMAMYRRLPEVHRKQLHVYRKQKKLSTVCMQLVGGAAPAPPPPGSPPPAVPPNQTCRALCPEYHLQRFKEVRRKVMHMRDQQLYYHRLRMWLEEQLKQERDSIAPESNVTLVEDLARSKRRNSSPKSNRVGAGNKRKLKSVSPSISKPHRILQMLKHKAPAGTAQLLADDKLSEFKDDDLKSEVEPPEAFPLEKDYISDTETIVGEKEADLCKEMKECLAKFANFALNTPDVDLQGEYEMQANPDKYPDSVSPPLQEMSPTTTEPMPVYTPKPNQRLLSVNKLLSRSNVDKYSNDKVDFQAPTLLPEVLNITPLNARRTPMLVEDVIEEKSIEKLAEVVEQNSDVIVDTGKDPNIYKYVTFGLEIKKAMEECQNIINSYNSIKEKTDEHKSEDKDGPLSLEQICEVMMNLDKNSAEFLDKIDSDDALDINTANTKLAELVENMPQILANMPEIATKLSEFANASFELPEFASIMSSLPDVNNEAQLTPETLKQIRELKLNKTRDSVKVTKNTTKRKSNRKIKNNIDNNDIMGTMTFEFDCKDISDLLKDEKELQALMKNKSNNKEDFKDLLFSISAQVVINKVFEYLKQNKSPELAKCLEEEKDLFSLPKNSINSEMFSRASTLFDNSVKDALSMDDLRDLVKSRFNSWKHYVASKFKSIPIELLENEIEAMLDKFYSYIQDLAGKQCNNESDKIIDKIDEMRLKNHDIDEDSEVCPNSKESLKQITKLLSTSAGNTFDLIIMKLSKMSKDNQSVRSLKFKYMDVIKRCADSQQLASWILLDPEIAANVILEMTGLPPRKSENNVEVTSMNIDKKREYFVERLREMNTMYMETLPKNALSGDEWLVMLYRLEEQENKLKDALVKACTPKTVQTQTQNNVSETHEAEILAGKGLSKIISKANARAVKKPEAKIRNEEKSPEKEKLTQTEVKDNKIDDKRCRHDAVLAKCEAILTSKGEKSLLDSFYTIKSYITQGLPVPETYKKHVISICSSIDAKLLDEVIEDTKKSDKKEENVDKKIPKCCQDYEENDSGNSSPNCCNKDKNPASVIGPPELLAKYSAQALRKAKQTLNAVAFRKNMMRNGQTKSESDACDTPKTDCKWTNDCICDTCKGSDVTGSVCLGDIVKQCYDMEAKSKANLEEKKKEVKPIAKPVVKQAKPQPKPCENTSHQQHVCKVGHTGPCASDGVNGDQPCTCCYCTVFGHAPPITTPVPRNFNETRERLRSILNKKKQKCKTAAATNGDQEPIQEKKAPLLQEEQAKPKPQLPLAAAKPPALPKTLPPNFTTAQTQAKAVQAKPVLGQVKPVPTQNKPSLTQAKIAQAQAKLIQAQAKPVLNLSQEFLDTQQKQLAERMARMAVTDHTDAIKLKTLQRTTPMQVNVAPAPAPAPTPALAPQEGKVNAQAMDQIRQQQIKQQQLQAAQAQAQLQAQAQAQKKPEPIYDLPTTETKEQGIQRQMQQHKQIQQQVQQQIHQHFQQQQDERQARGQRRMSICSRDSSVFSTSSSGGSCWRGSHAEDPRDLDALLQYIEGPSRHVDRGKKRAKKQRQKAKKMEVRLLEERTALVSELSALRRTAAAVRNAHASARRRVDEHRAALKQCQPQGKKGKKQKQNPAQQAKAQLVAEQLGELTTLMNQTAKELQEAESQVSVYARRLQDCENQLQQARAQLGSEADDRQRQHDTLLLHERQHQMEQHQREQQHKELQRQMLLEQQKQRQQMLEQHKLNEALMKAANAGGMIRVQRTAGDGVSVSVPTREHLNFSDMPVLSTFNMTEVQQQKQQTDKKQTWEQALHHMNQLVKKEKKKQKEAPPPKPEPKPKEQPALTDQPLSKKQRKALAKKQAEEEEARRKQQEAKSKSKTEQKKQELAKAETNKKSDKKEAKKEQVTNKKDDKKDNKKQEKTEKKGKENKQEKNVPAQQPTKQTKQQEPQPASTKKSKKKQSDKPQVINITPDTTIELVDKKGQCVQNLAESPAACSIMEQLSCGVQVADLKLPPGITLTRVQPYEKKEAPAIKSVPIWNCAGLAATPTPVARPPPVINADPAMMMFTTAQVPAPLHQTEPPKTIIIPEPPPQPTGRSKKAKKKAKKAAAAAENQQPATQNSNKQDGTKMVTLRNPMFHPNLPPVQVSPVPQQNKKPESIRIPDPIPMPPNACQATITPTSNGMYTIRNPLMSMMHQQSLMGMRTQSPQMNQMNPMFAQPNYNQYMNPNPYNPVQNMQPQAYVLDPSRTSPKNIEMKTEYQNPSRLMNLASFTQKNDEGYSLFKTNEDNQQRGFLTPESYYLDSNFTNPSPKPTVSPNPIGTRPNNESNRSFDSNDSSLFANNPIQRPEPIGTHLKRNEEERNEFIGGLYTPFGQEDRNVFRNALFDKSDLGTNVGNAGDIGPNHLSNGDTLPYFQRLRVGSKLNNEVTIHHVTESKFYKGQEPVQQPTDAAPPLTDDTLFSYGGKSWTQAATGEVVKSSGSSSLQESVCESGGGSPLEDDAGFGAVGTNPHRHHTDGHSLFLPDRQMGDLSPGGGSLEALQRYEQLYMQKHRLHNLNTN